MIFGRPRRRGLLWMAHLMRLQQRSIPQLPEAENLVLKAMNTIIDTLLALASFELRVHIERMASSLVGLAPNKCPGFNLRSSSPGPPPKLHKFRHSPPSAFLPFTILVFSFLTAAKQPHVIQRFISISLYIFPDLTVQKLPLTESYLSLRCSFF